MLQVTVTQKSRVKNTIDEFRVGKLFMIDLAGSERAAQTKVSTNPNLMQYVELFHTSYAGNENFMMPVGFGLFQLST